MGTMVKFKITTKIVIGKTDKDTSFSFFNNIFKKPPLSKVEYIYIVFKACIICQELISILLNKF